MNSNNSKKKIKDFSWSIAMVSLLIIIVLWVANFFYGLSLGADTNNERGLFGDMFGAVNALFSGLAFAGIILSLYMQRLDLKLQRKELKLTRKEVKRTNEEFKMQNQTMERQKFENTFFNMLSNHHQIIEGIDAPANLIDSSYREWLGRFFDGNKIRSRLYKDITQDNILKGRDVFKQSALVLRKFLEDDIYLNERLFDKNHKENIYNKEFEYYLSKYRSVKKFHESAIELNRKIVISDFNSIYHKFYIAYNTDYGHYFRNLYRMFKIIDEMQFEEDEIENFKTQYSYTSIIRAQLSDYEIVWLFFNCIHENGNEKFKPLIEKYTIFKNMDKNNMVFNFYKDLYKESAFTKPDDISEHLSKL